MSSTMNVHEAISARFFLTAAFLTMTIFMMFLQNEIALSVRDEKASAYRMCSMATSTSHGRTVVFLVTVGLVLFMILVLPVRPLN